MSRSINFIGHFIIEKLLEINNPYSVKIQWKITSSAPPFVKEVYEGVSESVRER